MSDRDGSFGDPPAGNQLNSSKIYSYFTKFGELVQTDTLPVQKYLGKTDPRTPPEFIREFERSVLYTHYEIWNKHNFLSVLGDSFYSCALMDEYNMIKNYYSMTPLFLRITWTNLEKNKRKEALVKERFDPNGGETWERYIIRTYIRMQDCMPDNLSHSDKPAWYEEVRACMMAKLREVGKKNLPIANFAGTLDKFNSYEQTSKLAQILYEHSDSEFDKPQELEKDIVAAQEKPQPDSDIENLPDLQSELSTNKTRPAEPNTTPEYKTRVPRGFAAANSFRTAFLYGVFCFILYYLIGKFWNFESN